MYQRLGFIWILVILFMSFTNSFAQDSQDIEVAPLVPITVDNVSQLTQWIPFNENGQQVQEWIAYSRGTLRTARYVESKNVLVAGASTGLYVFDGNDLTVAPEHISDFGDSIDVLTLSADEENLIVHSSTYPGHPKIYHLETKQIVELEGGRESQIYDELQFSEDRQTVYGIGYSGEKFNIVSWDVETGERSATDEISPLSQFVVDSRPRLPNVHLIVTPDGYMTSRKRESSFSNTATIVQVWDKDTTEQIQRIELDQEASTFYYVHEHNIFVTSSYQNNYHGALIWNADTGNRITTIAAKGYPRLSPDEDRIWFYDRDIGNIKLWDIETRQFVQEYDFESGHYLEQLTDNQLVTTKAGLISIWDNDNASLNRLHTSPEVFGGSAGDVLFTDDGDRLLLSRGGIQIVNTTRWALDSEIPFDIFVYDMALSPDNQSVAVALGLTNNPNEDMLRIYDLETGIETLAVNYTNTFASVAYHPTENYLAVGRNRGFDLALYSLQSGVMLSRFVEGGVPYSVAFSPDGTLVASGNADGNVRVYNTATRQPEYVIDAGGNINSLAFSHDGTILAVGTRLLSFYDATNGQELYKSDFLGTDINDMSFSPDDQILATMRDGSIALWNVKSGKQLWETTEGTRYGHIAFHPDGTIIVTASTNLSLWVINTGADGDNDGVDDVLDSCPQQAGDINGCPDSDADGFIDLVDLCPDEVGVVSGCPDDDNDGVGNPDDLCPDDRGSSAASGCPDDDNDGIVDSEDACPLIVGVEQFEGCPDSDADNIADSDDTCPFYAGTQENSGCPLMGNTNANANVRTLPSTNGTVVRSIPPSENFYIIGQNVTGDWLQIVLEPDGNPSIAWVFGSLVVTDGEVSSLPIEE